MKFHEAYSQLEKSFSEIKQYHSEHGYQYIRVHWNRYVNLLTFIPAIKSTTCVLEIGASILSAHIRKKYNCPVTVIHHPLEPEWKKQSDDLGIRSFPVDFMCKPLPVEKSSFDLIFFNEVMEHFPLHPSFFLCQIIQKLSPDGILLFTVPNFATSEKRLQLLFGHNPQDNMDRKYIYYAHHREPVMDECCEMIKECGGIIKCREWIDLDDNPQLISSIKRHLFHLYRRRLHPLIHLLIPSMRKNIVIIAKRNPNYTFDENRCIPPLSISKEYDIVS